MLAVRSKDSTAVKSRPVRATHLVPNPGFNLRVTQAIGGLFTRNVGKYTD